MNNIAQTETRPKRTDFQAERQFVAPPADISATDDAYVIELEMPGVSKEGIEVTVEGNQLSILGRRQPGGMPGQSFYTESVDADYCRSFDLGPDVDTAKIRAEMRDGILQLHLPKAERVKPRKIQLT